MAARRPRLAAVPCAFSSCQSIFSPFVSFRSRATLGDDNFDDAEVWHATRFELLTNFDISQVSENDVEDSEQELSWHTTTGDILQTHEVHVWTTHEVEDSEIFMSPREHNAVIMTVDAQKADDVIRELEKLDAIGDVETQAEADGLARLRVLPKSKGSIAADIGQLVRAKGLPVSEMFVEKGTLDDVFREITTGGGKKGDGDA